MNAALFEQLFACLLELENAVSTAQNAALQKHPRSQDLLQRLDNYQSILHKQRRLAQRLCYYSGQRNWGEVSRHLRIINGLSQMIRDDAWDILGKPSVTSTAESASQSERMLQ